MSKKIRLQKIRPSIIYPGSVIQQNHGETLDRHGYLLWDMNKREFTEHDLPNDWGYMTIDITDGQIPQWVYDNHKDLPKYPRIRVRFTETEPSQMKINLTEIQTLFSPTSLTFTRTDSMSDMKSGNAISDKLVGNIKDVTIQNNLIHNYLEQNFPQKLSNDDLTKIVEINNVINNELTHEKEIVDNNIVWSPVEFSFSNMFSYGPDNLIRFNSLKGLVGLFAPNASGKSSIWDAVSFCLFDKCSRAFKAEHIMNSRKETFKCKLKFTIDGETFFIERRAKTYRKGTKVKVDVDFWKESDVTGDDESLNGEQRRDTNKIIEQYVGTYDDFILTALSLQGNNALFIDKSQSERQDVLSQFIGVDQFELLHNLASKKNKDNITLIKKFKKDDFSSKLAELLKKLKKEKSKYNELKKDLSKLEEERETLQTTIEQLNEKLITLDQDLQDIDVLTDKKSKIQKQIELKTERKDQLVEEIESLDSKKEYFTTQLEKFDEEVLERDKRKLDKLKESKRTKNHQIDKLHLKIESQQERLDANKDYEYDEDCEYCVSNAKNIIEVRDDANQKLLDLNLELNELSDEVDQLEEDIQNISYVEEEYKNHQQYNKQLSTIERNIYAKKESKMTAVNQLQELDQLAEVVDNNISKYHQYEEDFQFNKKIKEDIAEYKTELSDINGEIEEANNDLLESNGTLSTIKSRKNVLIERINEVKELEEHHKLLEFYLEAVHRNGIPYELITKSIPALEGEINNILSQAVDFSIRLEVDGKNINANIISKEDSRPLELCSGMERFISGMAIRVALINVCHLPRPNFLVIDEGLGTLDSDHLQSVFMLFDYLKTQFEFVILISHLDTSRDFADKLIEIKIDEDDFSSIRV